MMENEVMVEVEETAIVPTEGAEVNEITTTEETKGSKVGNVLATVAGAAACVGTVIGIGALAKSIWNKHKKRKAEEAEDEFVDKDEETDEVSDEETIEEVDINAKIADMTIEEVNAAMDILKKRKDELTAENA